MNKAGQLVARRSNAVLRKKPKKKKPRKRQPINNRDLSTSMTQDYDVIDDTTGQTQSHTAETETHTTVETETQAGEEVGSDLGVPNIENEPRQLMEEEEEVEEEEEEEEDVEEEEELVDVSSQSVTPVTENIPFESFAGQSVTLSDHLPPAQSLSSEHYLAKYWSQRFRLFSLYDNDIRVDHGK